MDNLNVDRNPREMRVGRRQSIVSVATPSPSAHSSTIFPALFSAVQRPPLARAPHLSNIHFPTPGSLKNTRLPPPLGQISGETSKNELHLNLPYTCSERMETGLAKDTSPTSASHARSGPGSTTSTTQKDAPLPQKRQSRPIRILRYTVGNVYRRLFSLVFLANLAGWIVELYGVHDMSTLRSVNVSHLATAASANILVATMIRQDYVINLLFRTAWLVPRSAPIWFRKRVAKVYEFGGIHSGCGVAALIWLVLLTIVFSAQHSNRQGVSDLLLGSTYILLGILLALVIFAYPVFRSKRHNWFEFTHRFGGWSAVFLFWFEITVTASDFNPNTNLGIALVKQPAFWFLIVITFHAILPWLFLQRWNFQAEKLSNHAVRLHFDKRLPPFTGISISKSPLMEWHPFATFPALDDEKGGGSLIVSMAGDWTRQATLNPRQQYWVRGFPRTGVLSMACIFRRVVIVTTGSGIGPCLGVMVDAVKQVNLEVRVLWSAPAVTAVYGSQIVKSVRGIDSKAVIIDTRVQGRPDMVQLAYNMYVESQAEAIFVISNPMLTRKIVYNMESRGIPAFGPIWDS